MAATVNRADALGRLAELDGVRAACERAREACAALRFHEGLRRRIPEAAAESRIRGARSSAAVDGAELPVAIVRDRVRGAEPWPDPLDPVDLVVQAAVRVTVATEQFAEPGSRVAGAGLLARLHAAAAAGLGIEPVGRPREADTLMADELTGLEAAPGAPVAARRLREVAALIDLGGDRRHEAGRQALVVMAVAHAELAVARPFPGGNGLLARALDRVLLQRLGLDPTGVAVPEAGHLAAGPGYVGALAAYQTGTPRGVGLWLTTYAGAMSRAASEGSRVADGVRAGRML